MAKLYNNKLNCITQESIRSLKPNMALLK